MARNSKSASRAQLGFVEVKSKFDAEFRRFSVTKDSATKFEDFHKLVQTVHKLEDIPFVLNYTDPSDGDLLPINNDDNYRKALSMAKPLLRLLVQKRGESEGEVNGYGTLTRKKNAISRFIQGEVKMRNNLSISMPEDFRRVSAIIDVDIVPETHRRVKLMKNGSDKPLGFYIRDGTSVRVTPHGLEKVPGIFISRLVPGGLAESTGLLAVNDEVIEVNGIEVAGKTLDQATDMMVANSSNLIITVKPVNQRNNLSPRETLSRGSQKSAVSIHSTVTTGSDDLHEIDEEEDVVRDYLSNNSPASKELVQKDPKIVLKSDPAHNPTAEKTDVKDEKPKADKLKTDKEDQDSAVVAL